MKKIIRFVFLSLFLMSAANAQNISKDEAWKNRFDYNFREPKNYIIKNIVVEGNESIQSAIVVIYSGLSIGQTIKLPGEDLQAAIENLWKQKYFKDIQLFVKEDGKGGIIINISVEEQNKLKRYKFVGLTDAQKKNLKEEIALKPSSFITPNLINKTREKILSYYREKGFYSAEVTIDREPYTDAKTQKGWETFIITVKRGKKVKVQDFQFVGNQALTPLQLRRSIKKIKRLKYKINVFASSKFIQEKFDEEKQNIITKYQTRGYRDARIVNENVKQIKKNRVIVTVDVFEGKKYYFRNINWIGNRKFRTGVLDTLLGIKTGDVFNKTLLDERLFANPGGFDIQSLYMDDGYLFFNMQAAETGVIGDSIDIEIRINEGTQARIANVSWTGNTKTHDRVILREIRTKPGDIFSRAEIQRTMRDLAALGLFDQEKLNVNPKPNPADGTVDIIYTVAEKPSDQIELSGGYGGQGFGNRPSLIGTAGITLNNFSIRKLRKTREWNPYPAGDAQRLSFRAQSNGSTYQGYNFNFSEPWLGGKKPNSFSVGLFHTVNAFDFLPRNNPNRKVFFNTGMNISLGKRLKWPDDFFSIQYVLSLQQYRFQNVNNTFLGFPEGFAGKAYNPSVQIILTRTSINDMIYPTTGSSFTLSGQATPPFSLLSNKDYKTIPLAEKYRYAEFFKFKLDAEWYTPIWKKLVLMAKMRMGYLGAYNQDLGVTFFERFQLGGAGMFGFNMAATEIISQRGYDNFTVSQNAMRNEQGAPIFNKFTFELRYAAVTNPTATIYGLVFAEAGDAWANFKNYNPFNLKRSVGAGVRLFMPMFGLVGLDYGYGFDWRGVRGNSKPGQIHFFIGQQF